MDAALSIPVPTSAIDAASIPEGFTLFVDDVERCGLAASTVLGYFNKFIEHGDTRVVIIANASEIGQDHDRHGFTRIKEKVVARSFKIVPETTCAIRSFIADLPDTGDVDFLRRRIDVIREVHEHSESNNLRVLRHSISDFSRMLQAMPLHLKRDDESMEALLRTHIALSIEVRMGRIDPANLRRIGEVKYWTTEMSAKADEDFAAAIAIRNRYAGILPYDEIVPYSLWSVALNTGSLPIEEIVEVLESMAISRSASAETWMRLWRGTSLSDDEFDIVLDAAISEWDARKYTDIGVVLHLSGLFLLYIRHGLLNLDFSDVVRDARRYFGFVVEHHPSALTEVSDQGRFWREGHMGMVYASEGTSEFTEIIGYAERATATARVSRFPDDATSLLADFATDRERFVRRLTYGEGSEFSSVPILEYLDVETLVALLLRDCHDACAVLAHVLERRYALQPPPAELRNERAWLVKLRGHLQNEIDGRMGKISAVTLQRLLGPLNKAIDRLGDT